MLIRVWANINVNILAFAKQHSKHYERIMQEKLHQAKQVLAVHIKHAIEIT